ncbi:HPr kinase [Amylibacter marinus]|uniref:3-oxo-tetronate kinase n=1 Tax=Amylibacter marinus TaxID=1475483 RepID=A0ABQ5VW21_9RHOB|nr:3-oxo-tetronate kinase [Amylibacter marinus]GLQ35344.1 HPr kinase [Amylibacter marinus]
MLIGVIADDFTGASDIASTLAKGIGAEGGLKTAQFSGVPTAPVSAEIEAGVISLKSRSAPVEQAVEDSLRALEWLLAQGCSQIVFKYCSTFDSTPKGNIGPVADALADRLNASGIVVCPAFPATGRSIYQGYLFVGDVLLSESGMRNHPLTPMTDANIRRWLGHQTDSSVDHLPLPRIIKGAAETHKALSESRARFVVADAILDEHLVTLGAALDGAPLVTGGSGIALGLPRNFIRSGQAKGTVPAKGGVSGKAAILAGSCSGATRGQVDLHMQSHPSFAIDVPDVMEGRLGSQDLVAFIEKHSGNAPLVYSSGAPEDVRKIQDRFGVEAVAARLDKLFSETACALLDLDYRRIVVAGGETSGAVAQAVADKLKSPALEIRAEIDPGVPILMLGDDRPVALALKSGNFGSVDFFVKALSMMGDET